MSFIQLCLAGCYHARRVISDACHPIPASQYARVHCLLCWADVPLGVRRPSFPKTAFIDKFCLIYLVLGKPGHVWQSVPCFITVCTAVPYRNVRYGLRCNAEGVSMVRRAVWVPNADLYYHSRSAILAFAIFIRCVQDTLCIRHVTDSLLRVYTANIRGH